MKTTAAALTVLILIGACSPKKVQRVNHDGAVATVSQRDMNHESPGLTKTGSNLIVATYFKDSLRDATVIEDLLNQLSSEKTALAQVETILNRTKAYALAAELIDDPELSGQLELTRILGVYNKALLRLLNDKTAQSNLKTKYLNEFMTAFSKGCDASSTRCPRIGYFRRDSHTTEILLKSLSVKESALNAAFSSLEAARKQNNCSAQTCTQADVIKLQNEAHNLIRNFYAQLYITLDTPNSTTNIDLLKMFLQHASQFSDYVELNNKKYDLSSEVEKFKDVLGQVLNLVQSIKAENPVAQKSYCAFVDSLKSVGSLNSKNSLFDSQVQRQLLADTVQCWNQSGVSANQFKSLVDQQITQAAERAKKATGSSMFVTPATSASIFDVYEQMNRFPHVAKAFNFKFDPRAANKNQIYILDGHFNKSMDFAMALTLAKGVNVSDIIAFDQLMVNYIQLQTLFYTRYTYQSFADELRKLIQQSGGGIAPDMFIQLIKNVASINNAHWNRIKLMSNNFRDLSNSIYSQLKGDKTQIERQHEVLTAKLASIADSITLVATYPLTLALNYYMTKATGAIGIQMDFWPGTNTTFSVDAARALDPAFTYSNSNPNHFFMFGNLDNSLNRPEKLFSLDYALKIGLFEVIPFDLLDSDKRFRIVQKSGSTANSDIVFIKQAFKATLVERLKTVQTDLESMKRLSQDAQFWSLTDRVCNKSYSMWESFSLSELAKSPIAIDDKFNDKWSEIYGKLASIQAIEGEIRNIEPVLQVFRKYFFEGKAKGYLSQERAQNADLVIKAIDDSVGTIRSQTRQLTALLVSFDRKVTTAQTTCTEKLASIEEFRKSKILQKLVGWVQDIHTAMTLLNSVSNFTPAMTQQQAADQAKKWITAQAENAPEAFEKTSADVLATRVKEFYGRLKTSGALTTVGARKGQEALSYAINQYLGIHNFDKAPYVVNGQVKIGTYVPGLALSTEKVAVKRLNTVRKDAVKIYKWDFYMWLRTQIKTMAVKKSELEAVVGPIVGGKELMPLFGDATFEIGSIAQLSKTDLYATAENESMQFQYLMDANKFSQLSIQSLIANDKGYIGWFGNSSGFSSKVEDRMTSLVSLFGLQAVSTKDTDVAQCPKDEWGRVAATMDYYGNRFSKDFAQCGAFKVTAQNIVEQYVRYINFLRMDSKDAHPLIKNYQKSFKMKYVEFLGLDSWFGNTLTEALNYKEEPSPANWTWFDTFVRKYFLAKSFWSRYGNMTDHSIEGLDEFDNLTDSGLKSSIRFSLFPYETTVMPIIRTSIRESTSRFVSRAYEIFTAIRSLESKKIELGDVVVERATTFLNEDEQLAQSFKYMKVQRRENGTPVYLKDKDGEYTWFFNNLSDSITTRRNCLPLPTEADPDYSKLPQAYKAVQGQECRQRYSKWIEGVIQVEAQKLQNKIFEWNIKSWSSN